MENQIKNVGATTQAKYTTEEKRERIKRERSEFVVEPSGFAVQHISELYKKQFPELTWLVDRLVPTNAVTIFSAAPGSYKTRTLLHLATCVTKGEPLFGEFATTQAGVLIIDEESGERLLSQQLHQLGATDDLPIFYRSYKNFKLNKQNIDVIKLDCFTYDIKVIIFDSLIQIHNAEENDATQMAPVMNFLKQLAEDGFTVLVIAHDRKTGMFGRKGNSELRGSTAILGGVDAHISMLKKKNRLIIEPTKLRHALLHNPFYCGFMQYNGKQYKHKYPSLITKDLFDKCQHVREKRHNHRTAYKSLPFIFSDTLNCGDCGCGMCSYVSKNNVYMKCTRAKKHIKCTNTNVAERLVLPQLGEVLESIRLSDEDLKQLIATLNNKFGNQQEYLDNTIAETRTEYDNIKSQLKALTYERIEAVKKGRGLNDELFDQVAEELTEKQQALNVRLESLTHANFGFLTTISQLLDLAQNCNKLFNEADITTKNKLLRFMLHANSSLYDKKLALEVIYPYKALQELNKKPQNEAEKTNWCSVVREVRNSIIKDLGFALSVS